MQQTMWATILALVLFVTTTLGVGISNTSTRPGQSPPPPAPGSTSASPSIQYGVIASQSASLRSSPASSAAAVTTLSRGSSVQVMGASGDWYNVAASGRTGWVPKWQVRAGSVTASRPRHGEVVGYYVENYPGDTASLKSLKSYGQSMTTVIPFLYSVGSDGRVTGSFSQAPMSYAKSNGLKILASVHNIRSSSFSGGLAHQLLSSWTARHTAIDQIEAVLNKNGYNGVNIDFENVWPSDRANLSQFFRELSWRLRPKGYLVTSAFPAKTKDDRSDSWSGAYDYAAIAPYIDYAILMTYDEHYFGGAAGPIASIGWVRSVLKYATSVMPASKVVMGLAGYGYEWGPGLGNAVSFAQVEDRVSKYGAQPRWDAASQSPYLIYWKGSSKYTVWYENNLSTAAKMNLVNEFGLRGAALWRLGVEDPVIWSRISSTLQ